MLLAVAILLAAVSLRAPAAPKPAALAVAVGGEARLIKPNGKVLSLAPRDPLYVGDTIRTLENGRVTLRFTDEGAITLQPNSALRIDDYRYTGRLEGRDRFLGSVLKGALRAVTGKISKTRPWGWQLNAVHATIGIRGTDLKVTRCENDCLDNGKLLPNGIYSVPDDGFIFLETFPGGRLNLDPNQAGFSSGPNVMPVFTDVLPPQNIIRLDSDDQRIGAGTAPTDGLGLFGPPSGAGLIPGGDAGAPNLPAQFEQAANQVTLSGNAGLLQITAAANALASTAGDCEDVPCPVIDCGSAAEALQALKEAEAALESMVLWLDRADSTAGAAHQSLVESSIITSDNLGRAQTALGVQVFLHTLGSLLLDLASVAGSLDGLIKDGPEGAIKDIDNLYETLKDAESLVDTLADQAAKTEGTGPINDAVGGADELLGTNSLTNINSLKSDLSDALTIAESLKDLRDGKPGAKAPTQAVGQLIGRVVKGISEMQIEERKQHINSLMANLAAEASTTSGLYDEWSDLTTQKFNAIDALKAVRAAIAALSDCVTKLCPLASQTRPQQPSFTTWGEALPYYNGVISGLASSLQGLSGAVKVENICPPETLISIGSGETYPTTCPPCTAAARRYADAQRRYQRVEAENRQREVNPRILDGARQDRDNAWSQLQLCEQTFCPKDGQLSGGTGIGLIGLDAAQSFTETAKCPLCQPIADRIARVRAARAAKQQELADLQRRLGQLDAKKAQLERLRRYQSSLSRTAQSARTAANSTDVMGLGVHPDLQSQIRDIESEQRELTRQIGDLEREIETLEGDPDAPARLQKQIDDLLDVLRQLRGFLNQCEETACREGVETAAALSFLFDLDVKVLQVFPQSGNNPMDPRDPIAEDSSQSGDFSSNPLASSASPPPYSGTVGCGFSGPLSFTLVSNSVIALSPLGANGFTLFDVDPMFLNANSQSSNLIFFGNPGHSCQIFSVSSSGFTLFCSAISPVPGSCSKVYSR